MSKRLERIANKIARSGEPDWDEAAKFLKLVAKSMEDGDISRNAMGDIAYVVDVLEDSGAPSLDVSGVLSMSGRMSDWMNEREKLDKNLQIHKDFVKGYAKDYMAKQAERWKRR